MYQKLKDLLGKKNLTEADKKFIVDCGEKIDMPFKKSGNCKNCHYDHAHKMVSSIKEAKPETSKANYVLKKGINYRTDKGQIISAETMNDKLGAELVKQGFSRWFSKLPK